VGIESASPNRPLRRPRSLRVRGGIAQTFGSLFVVLVFVLLLPGAVFLYDAVTHPLTADAGQVLIGSICVAFSVLLVFFLVRDRR